MRTRRRCPRTMALAALVLLALVMLRPPAGAQEPPPTSCAALDDPHLVAQLVGAPVRVPRITPELQTMVAGQTGTAILFGSAIEDAAQVRTLIQDLDMASPAGLPTLVAVDEEGGRVARFGRAGVTVNLPSARQQALTMTVEQVRQQAAVLGAQMADLGVDADLGPVLDLSDDPDRSIIGDRSFAKDPTVAGAYGLAFAAGLHDGGIATTAKHFPDHGMTTVDTHAATARVDVTLEELRDVHLAPYRTALPQTDAIMLSHLRIDALDPDLPVSLSAPAVDFLRAELGGFDGVVMTDDLSMQAVADVTDQASAAVIAVAAGVDLVLVGSTDAAGPVHAALVQALGEGRLPRGQVVAAAARVLRLKGLDAATVRCLVGPTHYERG